MKKRWTVPGLALLLTLTLASCGRDGDPAGSGLNRTGRYGVETYPGTGQTSVQYDPAHSGADTGRTAAKREERDTAAERETREMWKDGHYRADGDGHVGRTGDTEAGRNLTRDARDMVRDAEERVDDMGRDLNSAIRDY